MGWGRGRVGLGWGYGVVRWGGAGQGRAKVG